MTTTTQIGSTNESLQAQITSLGSKTLLNAKCVSTSNITLSGLQTIDVYSVQNLDRVLVNGQTLSKDNGIYIASTGAWTRATDVDSWTELYNTTINIENGTSYGKTTWKNTAIQNGTLGVDSILFTQTYSVPADNSITNIKIATNASIDATKIADGSVNNTEFQYINSLTSNVQTQLNNKQPLDTQLTDLASLSYTGNANKIIAVKATEDGFELVTGGAGGYPTKTLLSGESLNAGDAVYLQVDGKAYKCAKGVANYVLTNTTVSNVVGFQIDATRVILGYNRSSLGYIRILTLSGGIWQFLGNEVATHADIYSPTGICANAGGRGIVSGVDNASSSKYVQAFTYSGNTITIGTGTVVLNTAAGTNETVCASTANTNFFFAGSSGSANTGVYLINTTTLNSPVATVSDTASAKALQSGPVSSNITLVYYASNGGNEYYIRSYIFDYGGTPANSKIVGELFLSNSSTTLSRPTGSPLVNAPVDGGSLSRLSSCRLGAFNTLKCAFVYLSGSTIKIVACSVTNTPTASNIVWGTIYTVPVITCSTYLQVSNDGTTDECYVAYQDLADGNKLKGFTVTFTGNNVSAITSPSDILTNFSGNVDNPYNNALINISANNYMALILNSSNYIVAQMVQEGVSARDERAKFIGFSESTAVSADISISCALNGSITTNQTGLLPGSKYYIDSNNALTTTVGSNKLAGIAITTTELSIVVS